MSSPVQPWYKRALAASMFAASTGGYLFTVTAVPLVAFLFGRGARDYILFSFACFPLAIAGVGLSVVGLLLPSIVAESKLQFPLNLTLPSIYCSLILLSSYVMANVRPSIALIGESPRTDQVWRRPDFLATAWLVQIVCMTFSIMMTNRKEAAVP